MPLELSNTSKPAAYTSARARGRSVSGSRSGIAIVLVLAMIAMTMAVSYSMLRSQTAQLKSSAGSELRIDARQAALSGLSAALRKMNQTSWSGADSTLTGTINSSQTYTATYTTGDDSLAVTDAQAADWPYRVTILSTGYATDTSVSTVPTTYKVQAVVDLVPKQVATNPTPWAGMQSYVLYQTGTDDLSVQLPLKVDGPVRFQGSLTNFCTTYPSPTACRAQYLSDLNLMRTKGYGDHRPFTGPISLPTASTSTTIRSLLTSNLGLTVTNLASSSSTGWNAPSSMSTYQLYPGGRAYTIPTLATTVSGISLQPDPRDNPAGLFFRNGDVTLGNNTTIVGTVISTGKVKFTGVNVSVQGPTLPALDGSSTTFQLPAVIATSDIVLSDGASATVRGTVATFTKFSASGGSESSKFDLQGKLICKQLEVLSRSEWNLGTFWWSLAWGWYNDQLSDPNPQKYLPVYMQGWSMHYAPQITIAAPTTTSSTQQWFTAGSPLYAVGTGDVGLRWSVMRMKEIP
ncbi:MAG: hypothetical protein K8U03_10255 [Planctomycetia bacterium]|nr:hypothetical protein [Planctomycetia bacterium]